MIPDSRFLLTFQHTASKLGWDSFRYPLNTSQGVTDALASIAGHYSILYQSVVTATEPSRLVYTPAAPSYVNDLLTITNTASYLIHVTQTTTLKLNPQVQLNAASNGLVPPATFYGKLSLTLDYSPTVGSLVVAKVNDIECGRATAQAWAGQVVYALKVLSALDRVGCGLPGQPVTFTVEGHTYAVPYTWNNTQATHLPIGFLWQAFLPLVQR